MPDSACGRRAAAVGCGGADERAVVPPGPAARRQPGAARRPRRRPGRRVLPVFVLDDALRRPSGAPRLAFLYRCLRALDDALDGRLVVLRGEPENVVPARRRARSGAASVHVAADFGPYGRDRDERVAGALPDGVELVRDRLAVRGRAGPGAQGRRHARSGCTRRSTGPGGGTAGAAPAGSGGAGVSWLTGVDRDRRADGPGPAGRRCGCRRPARRPRWSGGRDFRDSALRGYADDRDRPDRPGTSRLSAHLKYGTVHPRTLLADLAGRPGRAPRRSARSWPGGSSTRTCCGTEPESARACLNPPFRRWRSTPAPDRLRRLGGRAAPATRSSTPGCGSCGPRPGCTTGCG